MYLQSVFLLAVCALASANGCTRPVAPLIPSHDGYSTFGVAAAKSEYSTWYKAWEAFSDDKTKYWVSAVYDSPTWISYTFNDTARVRGYRLFFNNGLALRTRAPKHFQFQVMVAGAWKTMDERCCEVGWEASEERSYSLAGDAVGTHFRIVVFDDNDDVSTAQIIAISLHRIQLMGVMV